MAATDRVPTFHRPPTAFSAQECHPVGFSAKAFAMMTIATALLA
jgi:hypothetical protein